LKYLQGVLLVSSFFVACLVLFYFLLNTTGALSVWIFYLFGDLYFTSVLSKGISVLLAYFISLNFSENSARWLSLLLVMVIFVWITLELLAGRYHKHLINEPTEPIPPGA
jgi:hypothetical protein